MSSPLLEDDERAYEAQLQANLEDDDLFYEEEEIVETTPNCDQVAVSQDVYENNDSFQEYQYLTQPDENDPYMDYNDDYQPSRYSPLNEFQDMDEMYEKTDDNVYGDSKSDEAECLVKHDYYEENCKNSESADEMDKDLFKHKLLDSEDNKQEYVSDPKLPNEAFGGSDENEEANLSPEDPVEKEDGNLLNVSNTSPAPDKRVKKLKSLQEFKQMEQKRSSERFLKKCLESLSFVEYFSYYLRHNSKKLSKQLTENIDTVDIAENVNNYNNFRKDISKRFKSIMKSTIIKTDKSSSCESSNDSETNDSVLVNSRNSRKKKRSRPILSVSEEGSCVSGPSNNVNRPDADRNSSDEINKLVNLDTLDTAKSTSNEAPKHKHSPEKLDDFEEDKSYNAQNSDSNEIGIEDETKLLDSDSGKMEVGNEDETKALDSDSSELSDYHDKLNQHAKYELANYSNSDFEDAEDKKLKKFRKISGETDVSNSDDEEIEIKKDMEESCEDLLVEVNLRGEMMASTSTPFSKTKQADDKELAEYGKLLLSDDSDIEFFPLKSENKRPINSNILKYCSPMAVKSEIDIALPGPSGINSKNQGGKTNKYDSDSDFELPKKSSKSTSSSENNKHLKSKVYQQYESSSDSEPSVSLAAMIEKCKQEKSKGKEIMKGPRRILNESELNQETKTAVRDEHKRIRELKQKSNYLKSQEFQAGADFLLDFDSAKKEKIFVDSNIVEKLKEHQKEAVKFMYDNCFGTASRVNRSNGSGCILAHCMGLGKTLSVVALISTIVKYPQLSVSRILIICPKSTILNWGDEFKKWLGKHNNIELFWFKEKESIEGKMETLAEWNSCDNLNPGCFLIGYEAYRSLLIRKKSTNEEVDFNFQKEYGDRILKYLCEDPELVICDEGHAIKNEKSATNRAVNQIRTKRRIVLTGTPMQNHLMEYFSMMDFIKPRFLGLKHEFSNRFAIPITAGQHKDSSYEDIRMMKQRSFVLHNKLKNIINRKEVSVLKEFLPAKHEYVLYIPLTPVQELLYRTYLGPQFVPIDGKSLLQDYAALRKVWTHVRVLKYAFEKNKMQKLINYAKLKAEEQREAGEASDDLCTQQYSEKDRTDWWSKHINKKVDPESLMTSNKFVVLFEIIKICQQRREKLVIFSSYVAVLNTLEYFLNKISKQDNNVNANAFGFSKFKSQWVKGKDYLLLDGSTPKAIRHQMTKDFNDKSNKKLRLFLISSKAGGVGINLVGANRCVILDTSWNPSTDQQNIFRIYRLGQTQTCYVYRLLSAGTMEEKIYSRAVTKQAMSFRVVDKQQVDRNFSMAELYELYKLTMPTMEEREVPVMPEDHLLKKLLVENPDKIFRYHTHDSLLDNTEETDLTAEEMMEAWAKYESESSMDKKNRSALAKSGILAQLNEDVDTLTQENLTQMQFSEIRDRIQLNSSVVRSGLNNSNHVPSNSVNRSVLPSSSTLVPKTPSSNVPVSGYQTSAVAKMFAAKRALEEKLSKSAKKQKVYHTTKGKAGDKENSGSGPPF